MMIYVNLEAGKLIFQRAPLRTTKTWCWCGAGAPKIQFCRCWCGAVRTAPRTAPVRTANLEPWSKYVLR